MRYWLELVEIFFKTKLTTFATLSIIVYSSLQVIVMLLRTTVPDESWFLTVGQGVADLMSIRGLVTVIAEQTNLLGYGALYWIIVGFAHYTANPLLVMRGLAWLAVTLIPVMIVIRGLSIKSSYTNLAVALWLIMPVAWWDGKLIGPDLYTLALVTIGLTVVLTSQWRWLMLFGWMILGIALGIKFNVVPIVIYGAIIILSTARSWLRRVTYGIEIMIAAAMGFILTNPFILRGIKPWYDQLTIYTLPANYSWNYFFSIINNPYFTWDNIHVGGLFQVSLNGASLIGFVIFCVLAKVPLKTMVAGGVAMTVALLAFLSNGIFFGWYWFPMLILFPFMMLEAQRATNYLKLLATVVIGLAAITALPIIYTNYQNQTLVYPVNSY